MAKKAARIDKRINVILLESNKHLGERYEVVKVRPIFARNILFPQAQAVLADSNNLYAYHKKMEATKVKKTEKAEEYKNLFSTITNDNGLEFIMKANEKGILYEKVDPAHIVHKIKELYNVELPDNVLKMKKKISSIGEYTIPFVYGTLEKDLTITVKASKELVKKSAHPKEEVAHTENEESESKAE